MDNDQDERSGSSGRRRLGMGLNASTAVVLALLLTVMLNTLSTRHGWRRDFSRVKSYALSEKTIKVLGRMGEDVDVTVFFRAGEDLLPHVRSLLREYEYASPRVRVQYVDPDRDLARTKELALLYDVTEVNAVLFCARDRQRLVRAGDMAEYDFAPMLHGQPKTLTRFKGEQVFSSAIQGLIQTNEPVVYFLKGHGERNAEDYDEYRGYSRMTRLLRLHHIQVRSLAFGEGNTAIPPDCGALVIAGPMRRFAQPETEALTHYLGRSGRLMLLADPGVHTGLEPLLAFWGVRLGPDKVVGAGFTGHELLVREYGDHPITRGLENITTIFNLARSVNPVGASDFTGPQADKPRITVLASSTEAGFATTNLADNAPRFDPRSDRHGPVPVAVAVERGPVRGINVELQPTRLVVIGDSTLASNGALLLGYNTDFFLSAMNWLLDREHLLDIAPKQPDSFRIVISKKNVNTLFWVLAGAMPAAVCLVGVAVWLRRRYG